MEELQRKLDSNLEATRNLEAKFSKLIEQIQEAKSEVQKLDPKIKELEQEVKKLSAPTPSSDSGSENRNIGRCCCLIL